MFFIFKQTNVRGSLQPPMATADRVYSKKQNEYFFYLIQKGTSNTNLQNAEPWLYELF